MARSPLRIVIVLGVLITLLGGTGIFAVFSDRATTGNNTVTSGSRPHAADLQINLGFSDPTAGFDCNQDPENDGIIWSDDLATGIFTAQGMQPGDSVMAVNPNMPAGTTEVICLKNAGSGTLDVTGSVIDLVDSDIDCTGDEAAAGDTTCGLDAVMTPQLGELSPLLTVTTEVSPNCDGTFQANFSTGLAGYADEPVTSPAGSLLAPGQIVCLQYTVSYPSGTPEASVQVAQSDQVTWRFAFDGTAQ